MTQAPPGWYDQQSETAPLRWFDGTRWTDYSRLDGPHRNPLGRDANPPVSGS